MGALFAFFEANVTTIRVPWDACPPRLTGVIEHTFCDHFSIREPIGRIDGKMRDDSLQRLHIREESPERDGIDLSIESIGFFPCVDDIQSVQAQIRKGVPHRWRYPRRHRPLDFHTNPLSPPDDEEVEFSSGMRRPEIAFLRPGPQLTNHLPNNKTLPGCTNLGMTLQVRLRLDIQQRVKYPAVGQVYLGGFHLPLPYVLVPGRNLSNSERIGEQVKIVAHSCISNAEGTGQLRRTPDLSVVMCKHHPEAP